MATSSTPVNPAVWQEFRMTLSYSVENIPEYNTRLRMPASYEQFLAAAERHASDGASNYKLGRKKTFKVKSMTWCV
eukprot:gene14144-21524_t